MACLPTRDGTVIDDSDLNEDPTTDAPPGTGPAAPSSIEPTGAVTLTLTADQGAANGDVVSFGLPFPQGVFTNEKNVTVLDENGAPVAIATKTLAKWPGDGSIRSVLVAFKATLARGKTKKWKVEYGAAPRGGDAGALAANPDGPVIATLTADHYAASHVGGVLGTAAKNERFAQYETDLNRGWDSFDIGDYGVDCGSTSKHRTYYDGPHAQYQRALRTGDPTQLRGAHAESIWFRENELELSNNRKLAISKCQREYAPGSWTPAKALDWGTLRMMLSQGSLEDYLVTGDPAAREAVLAMGEAYRQNLGALTAGSPPVLEITERNLGWTLMGLTSYYALDPRNEVRDAMRSLVDRAIAWQGRGGSGALEHDINRPDPDECGDGPAGASPFMTSLVVDGMMDYWLLTADKEKLSPFMTKLARWYEDDARTSDGAAFRYLWNCSTNDYDTGDPDGYTSAELNLLIAHVFGATYALTKDAHWLEFGDEMVDHGIEEMFAKRPKQWNQASRAFGKYLGYRELAR
ncbi:MAG: hypothetical protein KIT84_09535 [Labilithrix sp.]|nr:hypothetical protein [Labilithrix sp.]MCW5811242.1 hypothetical protein [Labilithrix sp.]